VRSEPADVPPFEPKIDSAKWFHSRNQQSPRVHSEAKQREVIKQVEKFRKLNVIKPSNAAYWSQVHLAPKPNNEWRFCVDFRNLNDCMTSMGFPIPNTRELFLRLGAKRAKYYAVCDLTSGYFQMPIAQSVQPFFAFITLSCGLFEWLRLPMGPKAAGSYFQGVMATIVLAGILYAICELYMDDIIIFGQTFSEFLQNFEQVLLRFRKHKLTLNPKKCRLGFNKIQYVGKLIDENGLSMSKERRQVVANFPKPETMHDMQLHIFRDHIRNHSMVVHPLHALTTNYNRTKRLKWTPESEEAFKTIKTKIDECPSLFFLNDAYPIFLNTDASKHGIGAYLYQRSPDGRELPVCFLSKSLTKGQKRWSVPDREAYAIFYSFQQFDHLISDRTFTLRADHKTLTYINEAKSDKLSRWKIAIQSHDFFIEHVPGKDNIVADAFSRLCSDSDTVESLSALKEYFAIPQDKFEIISRVHNSNAGHHGVDLTLDKLRRLNQNCWPHINVSENRGELRCSRWGPH
jgi:hypothetical protein